MAKKLMIQGTMSSAGKSFLTAGLLRILKKEGLRAAPFKSQNMALNSYITREGLEMGRAQAVQAEAAGAEPSADMNPVLLKPTSDMGSQVIVQGVPIGNMPAREYFAFKKQLVPRILESFHRLEQQYDVIVMEGAGSPAEINLKQDDIVNMGLARLVDAPVLLAGDIDRGGVFAQLYGTAALLEPEERARIKGLVINKFRGDKGLLEPGIRMLQELCGIPVLGVIPMLDVRIEEEDGQSGLEGAGREAAARAGQADIAVIRFPRISNFTDFQVFSCMPEVCLRYVSSPAELGSPDLIFLPGSKNTIGDLLWMRGNGLEAAVQKLASRGVPVFGICGGYQMMGEELTDEAGAESEGPRTARGMGLIPAVTRFGTEKVRTRVSGAFGTVTGPLSGLSGLPAEGYEIHMGITRMREQRLPLTYLSETQADSKRMKQDGVSDGRCYGTYVHGIFDSPGAAEAVADGLLKKKGAAAAGPVDYEAWKQGQYDRLAEGLRRNLDLDGVFRILGL